MAYAYLFVDYTLSRDQAAADVADHPLLKVSKRLGPNGLMIGAVAKTKADLPACRAALLAFAPGQYADHDIDVTYYGNAKVR